MTPNNNLKMKQRLRRWDDVEVPMDGEFFDRLHDKIMSKIEEIEIESPIPHLPPAPSPSTPKPIGRPHAPQPLERYTKSQPNDRQTTFSPLGRYAEVAQRIWRRIPLAPNKS